MSFDPSMVARFPPLSGFLGVRTTRAASRAWRQGSRAFLPSKLLVFLRGPLPGSRFSSPEIELEALNFYRIAYGRRTVSSTTHGSKRGRGRRKQVCEFF